MTADHPSITPHPSRVAVIGAGAVGCYYGARIAQAGHDVHFLMRRDYDAVRRHGLHVASPNGDIFLPQPAIVLDSAAIGPADWLICALKATSIQDAPDLIRPCLGPDTRILVIMNGLGLEERFAAWFGPERIFGGLAFICVGRGEPGYVEHTAYGTLTIGHFQDSPTLLAEAAALWQHTRIEVTTTPSYLAGRWEKLCWNIPFNGLTIAAGAVPTDRILADPSLAETARALMAEVVAIGNADLAHHNLPTRLDGPAIIERMFRFTSTMGPYQPSTLLDYIARRPLEIDTIFAEPLRRAQALGIAAPHLTHLTTQLRSLDTATR